MRNVSTAKKIRERPPICVAVDLAIEESGFTNREVAALIGEENEQNVGRWRKHTEPSRDTVARIEKALGPKKRLGWIGAMAGYNEAITLDDLYEVLNNTTLFSDGYRKIIFRSIDAAIDGTAEDRAEQEAWRNKTASTTRRSRRS